MLFYRYIEQSVATHPITLQDLVENHAQGKIALRFVIRKKTRRLSARKFLVAHGAANQLHSCGYHA